MRRRIVWTTALLAVLLVLPAVPAAAAQFTLEKPDGDVTEATDIEVHLERDFTGERLRQVRVGIARDEERLGSRVDLECRSGCEFGDDVAVFGLAEGQLFDPATGEPFGIGAPMANGTYRLVVDLLKESNFQSDERFEQDVHLAVKPTAPNALMAEVDDQEVELTWEASPEPDLDGYRVERHDGDGWEVLNRTPEDVYVDEPGAGEHRYRVVAERPDGRDGMLETASTETVVEVGADEEADGNGGDENGNGEQEADREDGNGGNGDDDGEPEVESSGSTPERQTNRQSSRSEVPETGSNGSGSIPGVGERGEDDEGYADELDYGDIGNGDGDDVLVANPGGLQGAMDRLLDAEQIAVPVAAGLVMTGLGLHLWRWLRVPLP